MSQRTNNRSRSIKTLRKFSAPLILWCEDTGIKRLWFINTLSVPLQRLATPQYLPVNQSGMEVLWLFR